MHRDSDHGWADRWPLHTNWSRDSNTQIHHIPEPGIQTIKILLEKDRKNGPNQMEIGPIFRTDMGFWSAQPWIGLSLAYLCKYRGGVKNPPAGTSCSFLGFMTHKWWVIFNYSLKLCIGSVIDPIFLMSIIFIFGNHFLLIWENLPPMNQYFNFFFSSTHAFSLFSSNHEAVFSKKLKIEKKKSLKNVKTDATGLSGLCRKIFIRRGLWGWFLKIFEL